MQVRWASEQFLWQGESVSPQLTTQPFWLLVQPATHALASGVTGTVSKRTGAPGFSMMSVVVAMIRVSLAHPRTPNAMIAASPNVFMKNN